MTHPPPAPTVVDAAALADELARARVVPSDLLTALLAEFHEVGAAALAAFLVSRQTLTPFQADRALAGLARSLVLGPYRLTHPHQPGVLGPMYAAERTGGEQVAVAPVPLRSLWRAKRVRELARRIAALKPHPAVAPLLDADSANGFHYLVWPLVGADRLADRVAVSGPLPPAQVAALLAELAAGLVACHAAGWPHGMLSPWSVALPADGDRARLLDLGVGLVLADDLTNSDQLFDTASRAGGLARFLPYAAPEWLADPERPTPAGDQFSLGAVGYFALTGRPPSPDGDDPAVVPGVTRELIGALDRLLAANPADRFGGTDEAAAALAAAAGASDLADLLCPTSELFDAEGHHPDGSRAGAVSWGTGHSRPPERDDSDDSIRFDLPDENPAPVLNGPPPAPPPAPTWDPRPTPRPAPRAWVEPEVVVPVVAPPPRLPAAPLLSTAPPPVPASASPPTPAVTVGLPPLEPAPVESVLWRRLRRNVMFWKTPADTVRIHAYGPPAAARSEAPRITVFLLPPSAAESVNTLARAFDHTAILLGTGTLAREVVRGEELVVHLAVTGLSVAAPFRTVEWEGHPFRAEFNLVVPWEAPVGPAAGVLSVGQGEVRVGKAEFPLVVTATKG